MAKSGKFGTFGGVFTPAILTILGVIMYMRLPWIVGNGGVWVTWGVIAVAHVVSLTTGLSVSSMATDKRVKAGGSYYILSRSLGLPIGGALGIALFVGLSFSVSLYVIGFSESFLSYIDREISGENVRIVGTVLLAGVATVTLISTALAMKAQYFIMTAIAISLVAVVIGNGDAPMPQEVHYDAMVGGASLAVLFGIFFPAVTGFEAGVSMSGDLKDPKKSIPVGTMAAIFVGLAVYLALAYFLAWRIPADQLANNPRVLLDYAFDERLVVPGIWGATISSALGSILGAPRILQACAADGIGPKFFEKGVGAANEPRNALVLTVFIAWCGVLVGELDAIARVVSMFFLTSYGFLNFAAFVESWVSPDFRPDFRIPRFVSLTGALTCALLMIQLDLAAMAGACLAMGLLYALLKRRELALEGGDTWSGVWATLVRWSLGQLAKEDGHERNWRPHILSFSGDATRALAEHFVGRSGLYSDLSEECGPGLKDAWKKRAAAVEYHGLPGLKPNTILLSLEDVLSAPEHALEFLESVDRDRFNVMVSRSRPAIVPGRIDIWWRGRGGSLALALALVRSITAARSWRRAGVRFHIPLKNAAERRIVERRISHWLEQARVSADVRSVDDSEGLPQIERLSADAAITVLGLPGADDPAQFASRLRRLTENLPHVLLVQPANSFKDPFGEDRETQVDTPDVMVPERGEALLNDPTLAELVGDIEQGLVEAFIEPLHHANRELFASLFEIADECENLGDRALRQLKRLENSELPMGDDVTLRLRTTTWEALADFTARAARGEKAHEQWLTSATDSADRALGDVVLSTFRRLEVTRVKKAGVRDVAVPEKRLARWLSRTVYLQSELATLVASEAPDAVGSAVRRLVAARLGHVTGLHSVAIALANVVEGKEQTADWHEELEHWRESLRDTARIEEAAAKSAARTIAEKLANRIREARRHLVPKRAVSAASWLDAEDMAMTYAPRLAAIDEGLEVTGLDLRMSVVLQALRGGVDDALERMDQRLEHGLREDLRQLDRAVKERSTEPLGSRRRGEFDVSPVLRDLSRTVETAVVEVPDTIRIVPEVALAQIEADAEMDDTDAQNVAVRQLVGYLLETELLSTARDAAHVLEREARRAEDLLRDGARIVADISHADSEEDEHEGIVEELQERVDETKASLAQALEVFRTTVHGHLNDLESRLDGSSIASEAGELSRFVRTQEQRRLVSAVTHRIKEWRTEANQKLVDLSLRWDEGWVAARSETAEPDPSVVEELLGFRDIVAPSASTLDELPVFYRRTFTAQTNDAEFIVGGDGVIQTAREGVRRYDGGHHGALLVSGSPGAGTTSVVRRIMREVLGDRPQAEVSAPRVAKSDPVAFERAVVAALRVPESTSVENALRSQPRGSVIVVHDLELWWHRGANGLAAIQRLEELIEQFGSRLLFVVSCNQASAHLLRQVDLLEPMVVAHVPVEPLTAAEGMDAVMRRHRTSELEVRSPDGTEVSEFELARYFTTLRELTGGAAGPLLVSWLAHIDDVTPQTLTMRPAVSASLSAFNAVPSDWVPVIAALAVHRRLDDEGLAQVLGGSDASAVVRTLTRAGLFSRRDDVTELDRFMRPYVLRWLSEQGVLG